MSFYTEIQPYSDYIHSIRRLKNYISFDMLFPVKWGIPKNITEEGSVVSFKSEDQNFKGVSFVCEFNRNSIDDAIIKIVKIIKINKEKEIKENLFKRAVDDLRKIFEKTELEKLKNLNFDLEGDLPTLNIIDDDKVDSKSEDVELAKERVD
jgi:hypothetical protein